MQIQIHLSPLLSPVNVLDEFCHGLCVGLRFKLETLKMEQIIIHYFLFWTFTFVTRNCLISL